MSAKDKPLLIVENLKKNFGTLEVLKGVSFSVNKGEILSIIGSSGSGKTTLLRCLNFLEDADEGLIQVEDEVLFSKSESSTNGSQNFANIREKRLNFGMVFQNFNLFPQYTTLKNVMLPLVLQAKEKRQKKINEFNLEKRAKLKELNLELKTLKAEYKKNKSEENKELIEGKKLEIMSIKESKASVLSLDEIKKKVESEARDLLCQVGLIDKLENYPFQLSGGQQQRVAIARAMALRPKIICFDEPTSALDPELTGEVLKVIKNLRSKNRTMIIVTHEMSFARDISDKVIFMADGVIEEMGTPIQVFDNPKSPKTKAFLLKSEEDGYLCEDGIEVK
ncbi:MAG: amino acid ABC transporter ATP-binding protein [Christensenellales bacterium]|jgi:polar amino acid transport system ATP-binding protein